MVYGHLSARIFSAADRRNPYAQLEFIRRSLVARPRARRPWSPGSDPPRERNDPNCALSVGAKTVARSPPARRSGR